MGTYIWGDMNRATNDATTIDEAIATAITAHDDDPEAHLDTDQSLQSHRASEIIDHLAESVVNDKLSKVSRRYMAIVDPDSEVDFDTIAEAVDYCSSNGYGDIFIVAGTHYISEPLYLDSRINVYGAGQQETIIAGTGADENYIFFTDGTVANAAYYGSQILSGMTFGASGHRIDFVSDDRAAGITFEDCYFSYNFEGWYLSWNTPGYKKYFERCTFAARSSGGILEVTYGTFTNCDFEWYSSAPSLLGGYHNKFIGCSFNQSSGANSYDFIAGMSGSVIFSKCTIIGCYFGTVNISQSTAQGLILIEGCNFDLFSSDRVRIQGTNIRFINNWCRASAGQSPLVVSGSSKCVVMGNVSSAAISDSGTSTVLSGNTTI